MKRSLRRVSAWVGLLAGISVWADPNPPLGPNLQEIQMFGAPLHSAKDIPEITIFTFKNLQELASAYTNSGHPKDALRIADIGLVLAKGKEHQGIFRHEMNVAKALAEASLGNFAEAEPMILDALYDRDEMRDVASVVTTTRNSADPAQQDLSSAMSTIVPINLAIQRGSLLLRLSGIYESRGLFPPAMDLAQGALSMVETDVVRPFIADGSIYLDRTKENKELDDSIVKNVAEFNSLIQADDKSAAMEERIRVLGEQNMSNLSALLRRIAIDNAKALHTQLYLEVARVSLATNQIHNATAALDQAISLETAYHMNVGADELIARARIAAASGDVVSSQAFYRQAYYPAKAGVGARDLPEPLEFPIDQTVIENALGRSSDSLVFPNAANALGDVYLALSRPKEARPLYEQALGTIKAVLGTDTYMYADTKRRLANVSEREGDADTALRLVRESAKIFETLGPRGTSESSNRLDSYGGAVAAFMANLSLLHDISDHNGLSGEIAEESFRLMQAVNRSQAGESIAERDVRPTDPAAARRTRVLQDAQHELSQAKADVASAIANKITTLSEVEALRRQVLEAQRRVVTATKTLDLGDPSGSQKVGDVPMSVEQVRSRLQHDEAFAIYTVGSTQIFGLLITKSTTRFAKIDLSRQQLYDYVTKLRESLNPAVLEQIGRLPNFDFESSYKLYELVVAPLLGGLSSKLSSVFITAGAPLDSFPLSVLIREPATNTVVFNRYTDADWLVLHYAFTTLPAAANLPERRQPLLSSEHLTATAFGDPLVSRGGHWTKRNIAPDRGGDSNQQPIDDEPTHSVPEAHAEVQKMFDALGVGRENAAFGRDATEAKLRATDLSNVDILVFATHALTTEENTKLNEPALILTPPKSIRSTTNDGLLTASEIARMSFSARLVVLSACSTASSDGTLGAESLSGLASAFFYAGAKSLLVSHWAVISSEAPRITVGAIRRMRSGESPAIALQSTLVDILKNPSFPLERHPAMWAPFVLVGN
jgi:CHAT domain-containing protein